MILDKIENIGKYGFGIEFIIEHQKKSSFTKGKSDVEESNCFSIGLEYTTHLPEFALWEAHREYLDIHVILEGQEIVNISDITTMNEVNDYVDDYQLFEGKPQQSIHLIPGYFLLLFQNEVHQTSISVNGKNDFVRKIVYKKKV